MPIGMQLVGRSLDEQTLLQLGHAYQQATDWHRRMPPLTERPLPACCSSARAEAPRQDCVKLRADALGLNYIQDMIGPASRRPLLRCWSS